MKKLLSFLTFIVLYGFCLSSCTKEDVAGGDDPYAGMPTVELKIFLPNSGNTRENSTMVPDGSEEGSAYENTILASISQTTSDDLHVFAFKEVTSTGAQGNSEFKFISELADIRITKNGTSTYKTIRGTLLSQESLLGQKIKLVIMANYSNRGVTSNLGQGESYKNLKKLTFNYLYNEGKAWSENDRRTSKYIPMAGECEFIVQRKNMADVELKRAIAKVRIKLADTSDANYVIREAGIINATSNSFCLEHINKGISPNPAGKDLNVALFQKDLSLTPGGNGIEFYVPEQANKNEQKLVQIYVKLSDKEAAQKNVIEKTFDFKNYNPGGRIYPIERNYIYEFVLNKLKVEEPVHADVNMNIMKWNGKEIIINYE